MHSIIAAAGIITVGAITPGPNNLLVMRAAMGGVSKALPMIAAIVLGSLFLLAFVVAGGGTLFERYPVVGSAAAIGGALYIGWLGLRAALRATASGATQDGGRVTEPAGVGSVFALQFLNPKGWVMVLTAVAAVQADLSSVAAMVSLSVLFVANLTACLLLWSFFGARLAKFLARPQFRIWFDRSMGGLLLVCAILLLL